MTEKERERIIMNRKEEEVNKSHLNRESKARLVTRHIDIGRDSVLSMTHYSIWTVTAMDNCGYTARTNKGCPCLCIQESIIL